MALIFIDSFDHIDSNESKWLSVTIQDAAGRTAAASRGGYKTLPGEYNELTVGVAYKTTNLANPPITFYNERLQEGNMLRIQNIGDGRLQAEAQRVINELKYGAVSGQSMVENQWYYLELHAVTAATTVSYDLRVNEETWLTGTFTYTTTAGTQTAGWADLVLTPTGGGYASYFDDLYVRDDNTFHGDVDVICLRPNGTTTLSEWTPFPGTATNYTCVDDSIPNEDTDYVTATATGLIDLYEMEDVGVFTGEIFGVQGVQDIKKIEAGAGRTRQVWVDGITGTETYTSSEFYPSALDYLFHTVVCETNPFTTATWEAAEVDALRFGIERTV